MNRILTILTALTLMTAACGDVSESWDPVTYDTTADAGNDTSLDSGDAGVGVDTEIGVDTPIPDGSDHDAGMTDTGVDVSDDTSVDANSGEDTSDAREDVDTSDVGPDSDTSEDTEVDAPEDTAPDVDGGEDAGDTSDSNDTSEDIEVDTVPLDTPEIICAAGERSCFDSGDAFYICNEDGTDLDVTFCDADSFCSDGTCIPLACDPGQVACEGNTALVCAPSGRAWVEAENCGAEATCMAGICQPRICEVGSVPTCLPDPETTYRGTPELYGDPGSNPVVCDATGTDYRTWDACSSDEICLDGRCERFECWPYTARCLDNGTIQRCTVDGHWGSASVCTQPGFTWELGDEVPQYVIDNRPEGLPVCLSFTMPNRDEGDPASFTWDWDGQRSAACYYPNPTESARETMRTVIPFEPLWPELD